MVLFLKKILSGFVKIGPNVIYVCYDRLSAHFGPLSGPGDAQCSRPWNLGGTQCSVQQWVLRKRRPLEHRASRDRLSGPKDHLVFPPCGSAPLTRHERATYSSLNLDDTLSGSIVKNADTYKKWKVSASGESRSLCGYLLIFHKYPYFYFISICGPFTSLSQQGNLSWLWQIVYMLTFWFNELIGICRL